MVTLTNGEALAALAALREIAERPLPMATAMRVRQVGRELEATARDIETLRLQLVERLGQRGEDGKLLIGKDGIVPFTPEGRAAYVREYGELMAVTCEYRFALTPENLGAEPIAPKLLMGLGPLLIEPEESVEV